MPGDASFRHGGQLLIRSRVNDAEVPVSLVGGHQQRSGRCLRGRRSVFRGSGAALRRVPAA